MLTSEALGLENPFPGLRSFGTDESHLFFGREGQSDELLRKMGANHFVAVVGVSGCGKSSLVRAGLLPSLYNGYLARAGADWRIADLRPGGDPIRNLTAALATAGILEEGADAGLLRSSSLALVGAARQAHQTGRWPEGENLLILVDQFEELFRYPARQESAMEDRDEKAAFIKLLLEVAAQREMPVYVIITMRSDFLGDCAQFRDLPEAINDGQYLIPRMTREQRRSAIESPVNVAGGAIAARLVQRILNDTGEDPGQLPVMQHALMRTWNYWIENGQSREALDIEDYEAIGAMAKALSSDADMAYKEVCAKLPERGGEIVKRIFQRLRDRDANGREVRRPTSLGELVAVAEAGTADVLTALDSFRQEKRTFLVPSPNVALREDSMIDVTHECLLRQWERLTGWVAEEVESQRIYKRLADRAEEQADSDAPDLLKGAQLQGALDWWERRRPNHAWAQRYHRGFSEAEQFLTASRENREAERRRQELARQREEDERIEAATRDQREKEERLRADSEARERELKKRGAYVLALVALLAALGGIGIGWWALKQKGIADKATAAALADSKRVTELNGQISKNEQQKMTEMKKHQQELEDKNKQIENKNNQIGNKNDALQAINTANDLAVQGISGIERDPDRSALLALQAFDTLRRVHEGATAPVQDALHRIASQWREELRVAGNFRKTPDGPAPAVLFSPDGTQLAGVGTDGSLKLWDAYAGTAQTLQPEGVCCASWNLKGELVSGDRDGVLKIWRSGSPKPVPESPRASRIAAVAFSPDGQYVAYTVDKVPEIKILKLQGPVDGFQIEPEGQVRHLVFSPDGKQLAVGGEKLCKEGASTYSVRLFNIAAKTSLCGKITRPVGSVDFSPDGRFLVSGTDANGILLNPVTGSVAATLGAEPTPGASYGPRASNRLATVDTDGVVKIWGTGGGLQLTLQAHEGPARAVAFSPDGQRVATAGDDNSLRVWAIGPTRELRTISAHSATGMVALALRGSRLLTAAAGDNFAKIWDTASGKPLFSITQAGGIDTAALLADGTSVATARAGVVTTWTRNGADSSSSPQTKISKPVAFSPDGSGLLGMRADAIVVWDIPSGTETFNYPAGNAQVTAVAFNSDGRRIAWADQNRTLTVVDRSSKRKLFEKTAAHAGRVLGLAFSPDGNLLASSSADKTARIWTIAGPPGGRTLSGNLQAVNAVVFDAEGDRMATAGADGTARIWDTLTGKLLVTLLGHTGPVTQVIFERDHGRVITAGMDGTVRFYTLDPTNLAALVLDRMSADFRREVDPLLLKELLPHVRSLESIRQGDIAGFKADGLLDNAVRLARFSMPAATPLFAKARAIDPEKTRQAQRQALIDGALREIDSKNFPAAAAALDLAVRTDPGGVPPRPWNELCWWGTLGGRASDVTYACRNAVAAEPKNGSYQDSLAINVLALAKTPEELAPAIPHLEAFIASTTDPTYKAQRQAYVAALKQGKNPITPDELKYLSDPTSRPIPTTPGSETACIELVQGQIAWDYTGNKSWAPDNVKRLCTGTTVAAQPPKCFERAMRGGISTGAGTNWTWPDALALCAGTNDADKTIGCFQDRIQQRNTLPAAIKACQKSQ